MADHEKELSSSLRILVKSSVVVFIGLFLSKIISYVYRIVIARYYGPEIYGIFLLALMIVGWITAFASLGLSDGLLRFIPVYRAKENKAKIKRIIKIAVIISLITGIIAGILLFFLSNYISNNIFKNTELIFYLKVFSILIPISLLANLYMSILRAFEKISEYSFIYNILQNLVKLGVLVLFIFIGIKNEAIAFSNLAGIFIMLVAAYYVFKLKISSLLLGIKKNENVEIKEIFFYSIPIMFYGILSSIFYWIDSFSIGYLQDAFQVGIYNAAVPIVALLALAPEIFMQLFFPLITREYSKGNKLLTKEISKQVSKWILIINLPVMLLLIIFPGAFINLLFGAQYLVAINSLRILALSSFLFSIFAVSQNLIAIKGKPVIMLLNVMGTGLLNLVLNFVLIPKYGIDGAAFATLVSNVVLNALFLYQTRKYLSFLPIRRKMLGVILSVIIPTLLLIYFSDRYNQNIIRIAIMGLLFGLIYVALIFVTRSLDRNDLMIIKSIKDKLIGK